MAAGKQSYRAVSTGVAPQRQTPLGRWPQGGLRGKSLTMTYFHRRTSTIIGAKAFHCPVRDGKEWDHLAMVVRRSGLGAGRVWPAPQFGRSTSRPGRGEGYEVCLNGT